MVAQVALACVLLVGAALLTRSFVALMHADRGYDEADAGFHEIDHGFFLIGEADPFRQRSERPEHVVEQTPLPRMRCRS